MFNKQAYYNSRPDGFGLLEVVSDGDEKEAPEEQLFVPLKHTRLRGEITGPLAALTLVQTYGYSSEVCDKVLEVIYRFPLPGDAAVTHVTVRFGEVEIATELKERESAEQEYAEAVEEHKQAALLTRESPDVFTLRVAGVRPDEDVVIETDYVQLARAQADQAGWLLRAPLTTAPRYVREDELGARHAHGQPLALLRDPGHRFSLDVALRAADAVHSPTHALDVTTTGDQGEQDHRVRLEAGEALPDRDFVLQWSPRQAPDRPALSVLLHTDAESDDLYFLALIAPPATHEPGTGVPREVILLVDHSGSMSGAKWAASDWTVNSFLGSLLPHDLFDLGLFHNSTKWFARQPQPATEAKLDAAARYLDKNRDSGGTNLGIALEQALALKRRNHAERSRHVLVVTDAQVSDAGRIFRLADAEAQKEPRRRISVICIDAAPNSQVANELAERGGGQAYFLTSNPDEEDITTALEGVLADWAEPVLTDLRLKIDRGGGLTAGRNVVADKGETVIDVGDLPCGRAVWVAGRAPLGDDEEITFRVTNGKETAFSQTVSRDEALAAHRPALKALFGAGRLTALEYLINARYQPATLRTRLKEMGYDADEVLAKETVYAENALQDAQEALRPLLVRESLEYGIACAETAFIAVRQEAGAPIEGATIVANALPAGWDESFLSPSFSVGGGRGRMAKSMPDAAVTRDASMGFAERVLAALPPSPAVTASLSRPKQQPAGGDIVVFSGAPTWEQGQAVLMDSVQKDQLPAPATLSQVAVRFDGPTPQPRALGRDLKLLIFVGDLALPRATIRLSDLIRGGGARPLNLRRRQGDVVKIVLSDPEGVWAANPPRFELMLKV